jgi:hypothetical protein
LVDDVVEVVGDKIELVQVGKYGEEEGVGDEDAFGDAEPGAEGHVGFNSFPKFDQGGVENVCCGDVVAEEHAKVFRLVDELNLGPC